MKQDESNQFFKEIIVSKAVNEILLSLVVSAQWPSLSPTINVLIVAFYATKASPFN